jgi:hypothetical protein
MQFQCLAATTAEDFSDTFPAHMARSILSAELPDRLACLAECVGYYNERFAPDGCTKADRSIPAASNDFIENGA